VITEFLPLVKKGERKVIATISSLARSFGAQDMLMDYFRTAGITGPITYSYRVSKAALNLCMSKKEGGKKK
jgi:hypothetical protein